MSVFVLAMVAGVVGLVLMALPGVHRRGGGRGALRHRGGGRHPGHAGRVHRGWQGWIPEPRALLDLLALFGAFGNLLELTLRWPFWATALAALVPALAVEAAVLRPLWRWALQFQGRPSTPMAALVLEEARAVTAFKNGRGIVTVVRDGRAVQLPARLVEAQRSAPVAVGDRLQVQEVDLTREWVHVALPGFLKTGGNS